MLFHHSLEHTSDPLIALAAAAAAVRPGGLVLIAVPNFGGWQARRFGPKWYHLDLPRHRTHFTETSLDRLLVRAGFEVISVTSSSTAVGLPASVQYTIAGRCLFPEGMKLRIAAGLAAATLPLTVMLDLFLGGGDVLTAVARRPR